MLQDFYRCDQLGDLIRAHPPIHTWKEEKYLAGKKREREGKTWGERRERERKRGERRGKENMGKEREKRGEREGKEKGIRGKIGVKCKILKKGWKEEGKRKGDRDHASHAAISTLASQPTENTPPS